jgi:hypothetical protein
MRSALFWMIGSWACICMFVAIGPGPQAIARPLTAMAFGFIIALCVLATFTED